METVTTASVSTKKSTTVFLIVLVAMLFIVALFVRAHMQRQRAPYIWTLTVGPMDQPHQMVHYDVGDDDDALREQLRPVVGEALTHSSEPLLIHTQNVTKEEIEARVGNLSIPAVVKATMSISVRTVGSRGPQPYALLSGSEGADYYIESGTRDEVTDRILDIVINRAAFFTKSSIEASSLAE